jgi:surfeit locus 1 family protein
MDSIHYDTSSSARDKLAAWRALPRLLVSREWRWLTLGAALLAVLLLRLGFWQLDRLAERREINARVQARVDAPPIALTGQPLDLAADEFRPVRVRGAFDHGQEVVLRNQTLNGTPGSDILTPLRIDGTDQYVLINRGWTPLLQFDAEALKQFATTGPITIEGVVRRPSQATEGWGPQDRRADGGRLDTWFYVDVARIDEQTSYALEPYFIEQRPTGEETAPPFPAISVDYRDEGSHLSYALQWFSFAIIGIVGYAAFVVTRHEQKTRSGS